MSDIDSILNDMQDGEDCWIGHTAALELKSELDRLRERVRVLREAAQWVIDACNEAGNDSQVSLIIGAERCSDAMDAAKEAKP